MHIFDLPIEIFTVILEYLFRPDLLRCALTCKTWKDLALDLIWGKGPVEFRRLLELLCPVRTIQLAYTCVYRLACSRSLDVATVIARPNWLLLNKRRRQITHLSIKYHFYREDIEFILKLHRASDPSNEPFFPRVLALDMSTSGPSLTPYFDLFPPSIQSVQLDGRGSHFSDWDWRKQELVKFATGFPQINHLYTIDIGPLDYGRFPALQGLFHYGDFSLALWPRICAGCPRLEYVYIGWNVSEGDEVEFPLDTSASQSLPALRTLDLNPISNAAVISYILTTTDMPRLEILDLNLRNTNADDTRILLPSFAARCPLVKTLLLLAWHQPEGPIYQCPFKQVQDLKISTGLNTLTAQRMIEFLGANSNLARLVIYDPRRRGEPGPAITPESLGTLTQQWEHLEYLEIGISARGMPDELNPQTPIPKFRGLKALVLDPVVLDNSSVARPLVRYLTLLCPQIAHFSIQNAQDYEWDPVFISIRGCMHMTSADVCCKCVMERNRQPSDYRSKE